MIVYKTTNLLNGKIYVGKDEGDRDHYLGSGYILRRAIEKYGKESFQKEVLEICASREILEEREKHWIKELNATDPKIGYNVAEGGTGGNTYFGKTEEEMRLIKEKISNSAKGRVFSEEHRRRLAEHARSRKGNKPCKFKGQKYEDFMDEGRANFIKEKLRTSNKGKKLSTETKQKISDATKGRMLGPMKDSHKENLKKSFMNRDRERKAKTLTRKIEKLDLLLSERVTFDNVDKSRRLYQHVRDSGVDMKKYEKIVEQFKKIEFYRRSNRKTK